MFRHVRAEVEQQYHEIGKKHHLLVIRHVLFFLTTKVNGCRQTNGFQDHDITRWTINWLQSLETIILELICKAWDIFLDLAYNSCFSLRQLHQNQYNHQFNSICYFSIPHIWHREILPNGDNFSAFFLSHDWPDLILLENLALTG